MTLNGPHRLPDRTKPTTVKVLGVDVTTYPLDAGVFYLCTKAEAATAVAKLGAYVVSGPLPHVWAGDNPANPSWTVLVRFPDQTTADTVKVEVGAADSPVVSPVVTDGLTAKL